eukprot:TRINITY_DN35984_c0_g1_i1.p2 TRINITY_DN35984_c0_g1~~TRINITY_DN35984_c0_g1_i1.p2  ORF type:complete len:142 (-),score=33.44 TRINITY_DN35984_c0_g1_i1:289-714(-)
MGELSVAAMIMKVALTVIVMFMVMGAKAIMSMQDGPPPSAIFLSLISIGAGCNFGLWLVTKKGLPPLPVSLGAVLVVAALLGSAYVLAISGTSLKMWLHVRPTLSHVAGGLLGGSFGVALAPQMIGEPGATKAANGKKKKQ